ncbi:MAG: glycosyltransferase [Acidimicrobiia bacterium]|nr:glycosyltransferase [Acidimicrobiia bacterium]
MVARPLVSVIIPTFNRRVYLAEAVESAIEQTHSNLEVIVADDGSTDGTGAYVRGLGSDRILYLALPHRGRPAPARNAGLRAASGEFVAFLDSDDRWQPDKVATQLRAFGADESLGLVATDLVPFPAQRATPLLGLEQPLEVELRALLRENPIANSSVMLRRSVVDLVGELDESEELRGLEDYEYWLRVVRIARAVILPEPLLLYRRHEGNIGVQDLDQIDRLCTIVERHRDFDPVEIDSVLEELEARRAFRQAMLDLDGGRTSLWRVLSKRELPWLDRLRLARHGLKRTKPFRRG